jgi:hypothetical protein
VDDEHVGLLGLEDISALVEKEKLIVLAEAECRPPIGHDMAVVPLVPAEAAREDARDESDARARYPAESLWSGHDRDLAFKTWAFGRPYADSEALRSWQALGCLDHLCAKASRGL